MASWGVGEGPRGDLVEASAVEETRKELDRCRASNGASNKVGVLDSEISCKHATVATAHSDDGSSHTYRLEFKHIVVSWHQPEDLR